MKTSVSPIQNLMLRLRRNDEIRNPRRIRFHPMRMEELESRDMMSASPAAMAVLPGTVEFMAPTVVPSPTPTPDARYDTGGARIPDHPSPLQRVADRGTPILPGPDAPAVDAVFHQATPGNAPAVTAAALAAMNFADDLPGVFPDIFPDHLPGIFPDNDDDDFIVPPIPPLPFDDFTQPELIPGFRGTGNYYFLTERGSIGRTVWLFDMFYNGQQTVKPGAYLESMAGTNMDGRNPIGTNVDSSDPTFLEEEPVKHQANKPETETEEEEPNEETPADEMEIPLENMVRLD